MNFKKVRNQFNVLKKYVYFDNCASTLKPNSVCKAVDNYNRNFSVNSGRGLYKLAYDVTCKIDIARQKIANFISASKDEIIFTKNTTESVNIIALAYLQKVLKEGDEIIVSELEHHSNFLPYLNLAKEKKAKLVFLPLDELGRINVENFEKVLSNKTVFVALNYVSNTVGYITPVKKIIELAKKNNAKVLIDASQAVGHFSIDVKELNCDFLCFSGYKMFAPTGVGVLFGKKEILQNMSPLYLGGGMVSEVCDSSYTLKPLPESFEAGTLPISSIIGLGVAVDFINQITFKNIETLEKELTKYLILKLNEIKQVEIYNKNPDLPILIFNIKGVHAHDCASLYDDYNVCVRAGNHCASLANNFFCQQSTVRVSLAFYNTKKDIDKFIFATKQIIKLFSKFGVNDVKI